MGDKIIEVPNSSSSSVGCEKMASPEPVRSRWTPKPEQILILESIFNSGMVNPPKDETVRIRKLLEKFGAVGDANVFYWFQNRRSRSRRRQRQMQAGMTSSPGLTRPGGSGGGGGGVILCEPTSLTSPSSTNSSSSNSSGGSGFLTTSPVSNSAAVASCSPNNLVGNDCADDLFTISRQMGFPEFGETPLQMLMPTSASLNHLHYQQQPAGPLTVFINGIPSEVPRGPIDTRTMFGNDVMLLHSSGEIVPSNEYGVLFQGLQMGESYFLVSKLTF